MKLIQNAQDERSSGNICLVFAKTYMLLSWLLNRLERFGRAQQLTCRSRLNKNIQRCCYNGFKLR